jgi:lysylphosphatidylglycerol synthetase-like protein (DUF2156 family)
MLTQPKVEVFTAEKEKVSLRRVMLTIMLIGLMGALASPQPLDLEPTPWTALVRSAISILIAFFIIALALFGAARLFGGSGKFMQHLYVMATLAVPGAVVLGLMSRVDFKQALSDLTSLLGLITIVL